MSKLKKRIILVCVVLALLLTGVVAMFAFAAETVPLPKNRGLARMRRDIYDMYVDGTISKDVFDEYATTFEINRDIDLQVADSRYGHTVKINKEPGSSGSSKTTVEFADVGMMNVRLYGSAAWNDEMVNNLDLRQKFFLTTRGIGRFNYYRMKMGNYPYSESNLLGIYDYYSGEVDTLLNASKLYKSGLYNGEYVWRLDVNGYATASKFSYQLLDKGIAGTNGWVARLEESGDHTEDGKTIYQLVVTDNGGDQLRIANRNLTYDDLATLQLEVYMKSTDTLNKGNTYTILAKAVDIRERYTADKGYASAIVFEFYGEDWLEMEDQLLITGFKPIVVYEGEEAPSYHVWDMYSNMDLTDKFGISSSTPVTDYAGNEIIWEGSTVSIAAGKYGMDRKEAVVVGVDLSFSNFTSGENATEAGYAESFSGPWDFITMPSLIMNEEMHFDKEKMKDVQIQFNLRDENGDPVTSHLNYIYNRTDRNGIPYSILRFDSVQIKEGMSPQGEQIVVEKVLNEHLLQDRVGNNNLNNEILMTGDVNTSVWPEQVSYLDTRAPELIVEPDGNKVVTNQKINNENGKVETIQITVPFKVTDFNPGADKMRSTASGTTAYLRLTNPADGQEIKYKYCVNYDVNFPAASDLKYTGTLANDQAGRYASFGVADETKNIYLHMELSNLADYEISETEGLNLELWANDMVNNYTVREKNIPIYGVDNVAPQIMATHSKVEKNNIDNKLQFNAELRIHDTNGIHLVEYAFVKPAELENENFEPTFTEYYRKGADEDYEQTYNPEITGEYEVTEANMDRVLLVRAYDKNNNRAYLEVPFVADMNKVISSYSLTEDIFKPSAQTGIMISEPYTLNGTELSENASTRVTVVVPTVVDGTVGQDIYFRVIPASELTDEVQALDPNAVWYKAGSWTYLDHTDLGYYVYEGVTQEPAGKPGWLDHYGEMDVYVASANSDMLQWIDENNNSLTLDPEHGGSGEQGSTYSWSKIGTVSHAANVNDAYTMEYTKDSTRVLLTDSTGTEVPALIKWENDDYNTGVELYRYAIFNKTLAGVQVGVSFENQLFEDWGTDGIDFANSYAYLVRADENGTLIKDAQGNYDVVTEKLHLNQSLNQTLTVPNTLAEGESFTSGVYTWIVHVAQKGGGSSEFVTPEVYMILDNADVPENFGVLEHTTKIQAVDGYWDHQYITNTIKPDEGKNTLDVINIGIAKPTAMMVAEKSKDDDGKEWVSYVYSESLEQVQVNGITAYLKGVANSSEFGSSYQNTQYGKFTITADMTDSGYGTFLGQEVGTVEGIRFWNKANVDDYTAIEYIKKDQPYRDSSVRGVNAEFSQENGVAKLDVSFNVAWYMPGDNPLYENAEALKTALPNGNFGVIDGENTICYQLLMDNGKQSPVYQFTLNLVKEVPQVYVDYEFGPYYENLLDGKTDRYLESATLYFSNMFSEYSGLKVYHVHFVKGGTDYYEIKQLTDDEITNGYTINEGCSGYNDNYSYDRNNFGYQGTRINGTSLDPEGSESFFVIVDNSGNAVTIYPMDSTSGDDSDEYSEVAYEKHHAFDKFLPEKMSYVGFEDGLHLAALTYPGFDYMGRPAEADFYFGNAETIDFRIDADRASTDEEKEALWVNYSVANYDNVTVPNASGFAEIEARYQNEIGFAVPYDSTVAEGEMISHTAEIKIYGMPDETGFANYVVEKSVTFQAPNTKPAIVKVESRGGNIIITYNMAVSTAMGASDVQYIPVTDDSIYGTSYTHTFQDLFGNEYTETFTVPVDDGTLKLEYFIYNDKDEEIPIDPTVDFVEDQLYIRATTTDGKSLMLFRAPEGVESYSVSNGIEIMVPFNCNFIIYYYTPNREMIPYSYVEVNNIYKSLTPDPYISWDYNAGHIQDGNVVYGDVTAHLVDRNGQAILDPATGAPAMFVFTADGPESYTFTGCYTEVTKEEISDITATLEVELQPEPIETADTFAPDVDVVAYLSNASGAKPTNLVYRQSSGRFAMTDYAFRCGVTDEAEAEKFYYSDIAEMVSKMGWSDSYMFHLDVHDESRVKLLLKENIYESGVNYKSTSDEITGVTLVGRTLQVSDNCEFALYIVDEKDNITALHFVVSNLGNAPEPGLVQISSVTADGKPAVRVYLLPPQIDNYQNLMITNDGKITDNEEFEGVDSDYKGLDYMLYDQSGTYPIYYTYEVNGTVYGKNNELSVTVDVPELTPPAVVQEFWSANYYNTATNQEIALNLKLNVPVKNISVVYTVGEAENLISSTDLMSYGIHVGYFQDDCTITFQQNTDVIQKMMEEKWGEGTIRLKMTEMTDLNAIYGSIGYYELPEVTNIDNTAPELEGYEIDVNQADYKSALITLTLKDTALSGDGRQKGTEFQYTVRENKTYTYSFVDDAGNRAEFDVEVTNLITDPLKITLSADGTEAGIIQKPSEYKAEVGQTLYAKLNRAGKIFLYDESNNETPIMVNADIWTQITVTENSMGMHPSIVARDTYGNSTIVQLEYIPIRDITAPFAILHRDTVSVSASATDAEIEQVLMDNIVFSDDSTAKNQLDVKVEFIRIPSGKTVATYTITDEANNVTIRECYLRFRSGLEPVIYVNGQLVEDGAFLYVSDTNDLDVQVSFDGQMAEPYKIVYEQGDLRSWAKLKNGTWLTAGYTDEDQTSQSYQIKDMGDGWYSFALTTQGMEIYYFQVHIGAVR